MLLPLRRPLGLLLLPSLPPPLAPQARGRTGEQLRSEIAHLAARHPPAPVFLPHVTVLGDIDGPREEVVRVARELAQQVKVRVCVGWGRGVWGVGRHSSRVTRRCLSSE